MTYLNENEVRISSALQPTRTSDKLLFLEILRKKLLSHGAYTNHYLLHWQLTAWIIVALHRTLKSTISSIPISQPSAAEQQS